MLSDLSNNRTNFYTDGNIHLIDTETGAERGGVTVSHEQWRQNPVEEAGNWCADVLSSLEE